MFDFEHVSLAFGQEQEKNPCDKLYLDLKKGTLNGMMGTASMEEVKKAFPCFTGDTEENSDGMNCGGGVFFLKNDFNIYTKQDFIRVKEGFSGQLSSPEVIEILVEPNDTFVHTDEWLGDKITYMQYRRKWGTLVLLVMSSKVTSIELHYDQKIGDIDFCF